MEPVQVLLSQRCRAGSINWVFLHEEFINKKEGIMKAIAINGSPRAGGNKIAVELH